MFSMAILLKRGAIFLDTPEALAILQLQKRLGVVRAGTQTSRLTP
jgi:hypothetical protein